MANRYLDCFSPFFSSLLFCRSKELHAFFFTLIYSLFERCFIGLGENTCILGSFTAFIGLCPLSRTLYTSVTQRTGQSKSMLTINMTLVIRNPNPDPLA